MSVNRYGNGTINMGGRIDAKPAADAETKARDAMRARTAAAHRQPTIDGVSVDDAKQDAETLPSGKTLENTYARPLEEVRASIRAAARTASACISDPVEREKAIARYVANAERRIGGTK